MSFSIKTNKNNTYRTFEQLKEDIDMMNSSISTILYELKTRDVERTKQIQLLTNYIMELKKEINDMKNNYQIYGK